MPSLSILSFPVSLAKSFNSSVETLRKFSSFFADIPIFNLFLNSGFWVVTPTGALDDREGGNPKLRKYSRQRTLSRH